MSITGTKAAVGYMVFKVFDDNPSSIAAWNSAAHVEAPPKSKPKPPPTP